MHHFDDDGYEDELYALQDNTIPDLEDRETPRQKRLRERLIIDRERQRIAEQKYSGPASEEQEMRAYKAYIHANGKSALSFHEYQAQERALERRAPIKRHKKNPRWKDEMKRKPRKEVDGRPVGFGSWYQREYHDYTREEFLATQSSADRIRTRDCKPMDQLQRDENDDDSHCESDWFDRTSYECYYKQVPRKSKRSHGHRSHTNRS